MTHREIISWLIIGLGIIGAPISLAVWYVCPH